MLEALNDWQRKSSDQLKYDIQNLQVNENYICTIVLDRF